MERRNNASNDVLGTHVFVLDCQSGCGYTYPFLLFCYVHA